MISLTDPAFVRAVGSLPDSGSAGTVTDSQIDASIILAMSKMIELLGQPAYVALQTWDGASPAPATVVPTTDGSVLTMLDQQYRWQQAEACFALSRLVFAMSSAAMGATGIKQTVETSKARTDFASMEEGRKDRQAWDDQAFRWLAPFLSGQAFDPNSVPIGFRNRRKTFFITSCESPDDPTF